MNLSVISKISEDEARALLERIRWPNGAVCSVCGAVGDHPRLTGKKNYRPGLYQCREIECRSQFTVTVGTIMEDTHLPIRTWLMAFSILCSAKKGVSALQLQRQLGLGSYRTAWHLCHRIRHAMGKEPMAGLLSGAVIADETYIGGKPRHYQGPRKGPKFARGRGTKKTPVVLVMEKDGRARARSVERVTAKTLTKFIRDNVDPTQSALHTDEHTGYSTVGKEFAGGHETVNHGKRQYVRADGMTTNPAESYFALLKRGITGSFHSVSDQHLDKYCDEFSFRWNARKLSDGERTVEAIKSGDGRRLMYKTPKPAKAKSP